MGSGLQVVGTVFGRDLAGLPPADLAQYIGFLEKACRENPGSADLWTCLGLAHAMKGDPERSRVALERAVQLGPSNFWARLKYATILSQSGSADLSKRETLEALRLASNPVELSLAKTQLNSIRRRSVNHLGRSALLVLAITAVVSLVAVLR